MCVAGGGISCKMWPPTLRHLFSQERHEIMRLSGGSDRCLHLRSRMTRLIVFGPIWACFVSVFFLPAAFPFDFELFSASVCPRIRFSPSILTEAPQWKAGEAARRCLPRVRSCLTGCSRGRPTLGGPRPQILVKGHDGARGITRRSRRRRRFPMRRTLRTTL